MSSVLGPENFGNFLWAQSNFAYFLIFVSLGLDTLGVREISKNREDVSEFASLISTLRLVLSIIVYGIMLVYIMLIDKPMALKIVMMVSGLGLIGNALLIDWVYLGIEKMRLVAFKNFFLYFVNFAGVYLFVKEQDDTVLAMIVISISLVVNSSILIYYFNKKIGKFRLQFDLKRWISLLKEAIPIGVSFMMMQIFSNADILMLGFLRERFDYESGILGGATRIMVISILPAHLLQRVFYPIFAKYHDQDARFDYLKKFHLILVGGGVFFGQFLFLFSEELILIQFSQEFIEASIMLQYLVPRVILAYMVIPINTAFLAWGYQKQIMYAYIFTTVVNITMNYLLIPDMGPTGAIIASISSEFIIFIFFTYLSFKTEKQVYLMNYLQGVLLLALTYGSAYFLLKMGVHPYLTAIIDIAVFTSLALLLKVISIKDIKQMLGK